MIRKEARMPEVEYITSLFLFAIAVAAILPWVVWLFWLFLHR